MIGLNSSIAQTANSKANATTPRSGWRVQCNDVGAGLKCMALQMITLRRTRQKLLTVSVQRGEAAMDAAALEQLPHGIFLPTGVSVAVDKTKPKKLAFQICDALGCYAGTSLIVAEISVMRHAYSAASGSAR